MWMRWVCAVALMCAAASPATAAIVWTHEPVGATLHSDWPMQSLHPNWDFYGGVQNYITDATAPSGDNTVLHQYHENYLTTSQGWFGGPFVGQPRELYFGFLIKLSNPFAGYPNNANKIFWAVTNTQYQAMEFYGYQQSSYPVVWSWTYDGTNDNGHIPGCASNDNCWLGGTWQTFAVGQWVKVEAYLKFSTTNASQDGIVRWWVNGTQIGNYTTVNFPGSFFTHVEITPTWDGGTPNANTFWERYDHVRVSLPNGGEPQPTPPGGSLTLTILSLAPWLILSGVVATLAALGLGMVRALRKGGGHARGAPGRLGLWDHPVGQWPKPPAPHRPPAAGESHPLPVVSPALADELDAPGRPEPARAPASEDVSVYALR